MKTLKSKQKKFFERIFFFLFRKSNINGIEKYPRRNSIIILIILFIGTGFSLNNAIFQNKNKNNEEENFNSLLEVVNKGETKYIQIGDMLEMFQLKNEFKNIDTMQIKDTTELYDQLKKINKQIDKMIRK